MRDTERILIGLNLAGSAVAGVRDQPVWFLVAAVAFGVYAVVEDRALRRRIGSRAWPSEGFARFTFGTNLSFGLSQLTLGAIVFAAGKTATALIGY